MAANIGEWAILSPHELAKEEAEMEARERGGIQLGTEGID